MTETNPDGLVDVGDIGVQTGGYGYEDIEAAALDFATKYGIEVDDALHRLNGLVDDGVPLSFAVELLDSRLSAATDERSIDDFLKQVEQTVYDDQLWKLLDEADSTLYRAANDNLAGVAFGWEIEKRIEAAQEELRVARELREAGIIAGLEEDARGDTQ